MALDIWTQPRSDQYIMQGAQGLGAGINQGLQSLGDAWSKAIEVHKKEGDEAKQLRVLGSNLGVWDKPTADKLGINELRGGMQAYYAKEHAQEQKAKMEDYAARAADARAQALERANAAAGQQQLGPFMQEAFQTQPTGGTPGMQAFAGPQSTDITQPTEQGYDSSALAAFAPGTMENQTPAQNTMTPESFARAMGKHGGAMASPHAAQIIHSINPIQTGADAYFKGPPGKLIPVTKPDGTIVPDQFLLAKGKGLSERFEIPSENEPIVIWQDGFAFQKIGKGQYKHLLLPPDMTTANKMALNTALSGISGNPNNYTKPREEVDAMIDAEMKKYGKTQSHAPTVAPTVPPPGASVTQPAPYNVTTKAQFDALPPGATYIGKNGQMFRKP